MNNHTLWFIYHQQIVVLIHNIKRNIFRLSLKSNRNDIGKVFRVLVEGPSKKNPEELCGRSGSNKMCVFPGGGHKAGDYVDVEVVSCTSATLIGKLV